jgi:DNA-binding MarR family transcriptional regulator
MTTLDILVERNQDFVVKRRRYLARLTEDGREALASALPYWEQAQHRVVTRLGQEQWHALRSSLQATMMLA